MSAAVRHQGVGSRHLSKFDGTSCLVKNGELYKRYDAKHGKTPPEGFVPAEEAPDVNTGHWPGWLKVSDAAPEDRWHREAFAGRNFADGTYELVGPKVQGNKYGKTAHELIRHGSVVVEVARTRADLLKCSRTTTKKVSCSITGTAGWRSFGARTSVFGGKGKGRL